MVNGDNQNLTLKEKFTYMIFHIWIFFKQLFVKSTTKCEKIIFNQKYPRTLNSPFRDYIDAFLQAELQLQIKENVSILDIGCGQGYLYEKLKEAGFSGIYTGVDVKISKPFAAHTATRLNKKFIQCSAEDMKIQNKFNLIASITSLEHIEDDRKVLKNTAELLKEGGTEIHVVPASSTIFLYFLHGWRQYSVNMLKDLMTDREATIKMYQGGGIPSFIFHFIFITIPIKLRFDYKKSNGVFILLKRLAMRLDKFLPFIPVVYCIVSKKK